MIEIIQFGIYWHARNSAVAAGPSSGLEFGAYSGLPVSSGVV
ncbi:hypothetical protein [Naumannella huperziae]